MGSVDIGIDLGTANVLITLGKKGIVINEPSMVAYNTRKKRVIAVGDEAYKMVGRTPVNIIVVRPMKDGVISDNVMTEVMIKEYIGRLSDNMLVRPRVIICVPSAVTEVENRAVTEAALSAGAREVWLIEEPIAALLGAGADISRPGGKMVVDIGGGTADIAVVSMYSIVINASVKCAGDKIDRAIIAYLRSNFQLSIGEKTAEEIKIKIADVFRPTGNRIMDVKGIDLQSGLPRKMQLTDRQIHGAVIAAAEEIIHEIKTVLEKTPPELSGDILQSGIILTGGGALLTGFDRLVAERIGSPCIIAPHPLECVALGISKAFSHIDDLNDGFEKVRLMKFR